MRASATVVYVSGSVGCPTGLCARMLRSNDDGLHYERVNLPTVARTESAMTLDSLIEDAQFASPSDGYLIVNGVFYMTNDGARTWHVVSFGPKESVLAVATTPQWAYATVSDCSFACGTDQLARSVTGSMDWLVVSVARARTTATEVAAAVGQSVWLASGIGRAEVTLSLSTNEGKTFVVVWRQPMVDCGLYPPSDTVVWLDCSGGMMGDWFRSTDGGRHFRFIPIETYHGVPFDPVTNTVAFYLPEASTQVYRTTNGGESFKLRGVIAVKGEVYGVKVSFANALQGLALVYPQEELFRTTDGGVTWTRVRV